MDGFFIGAGEGIYSLALALRAAVSRRYLR